MEITTKGKIKLVKADGTVISQHNDVKEAYENASEQPAGTYRILFPDQEVVIEAHTCPTDPEPPVDPPVDPPTTSYNHLSPLTVNPTTTLAKPARGTWVKDPAYGLRIKRATTPTDGSGGRMRHFYSRRTPFNANNTRYLCWTGDGYWYVYDTATCAPIWGPVPGMGGSCEAIWHPTNPDILYHTGGDGVSAVTNTVGVWKAVNVASKTSNTAFTVTASPFTAAGVYWTKGEGTMSADGKYICLMAERASSYAHLGSVVVDVATGTVVGSRATSQRPDHVSMSQSGTYAVVSSTGSEGTRAYTRDFKSFVQLAPGSEHSDLGRNTAGEDMYVWADYNAGKIRAMNIATGEKFDLVTLYPRSGSGYACHISCQGPQGWALISSYADFGNYNTYPDPQQEPQYKKLFLVELKPAGRVLNVTPTRQTATDYFAEPQAVLSRDGKLAMFGSNFGEGTATDSYIVEIVP